MAAVLAIGSAAPVAADVITVNYTYNSLEAYVGEYMGPEYLVYTVPDPPVKGQDYWVTHLLECDAELIIEQTTEALTYDPAEEWIEVVRTVTNETPNAKYLASFTEHYKWVYEPGHDPMTGDWVDMGVSSKVEGTVDMYWYEYDARVVPEPATLSLLALGSLTLFRKRRKQ